MLMLSARGFPLSEIDRWNTGMLMDWIYAYDRLQRGDVENKDYERYQTLKEIEPAIDEQYANGEINETKYLEFKKTLKNIESKMG